MHDVIEFRPVAATTYSARKPLALGEPVSPAPMVDEVVVRGRRRKGVVAEARMIGRERDCMMCWSWMWWCGW